MDWADDVTYAVHDLEDFYRVGMIPIDRICTYDTEATDFVEWVANRWTSQPDKPNKKSAKDLAAVLDPLRDLVNSSYDELLQPFTGTVRQRAQLRTLTSQLISRHVQEAVELRTSAELDGTAVTIDPDLQIEVLLLKELTWRYVIENPSLATQQEGQRSILRHLFGKLTESARSDRALFPPRYRHLLDEEPKTGNSENDEERRRLRIVTDLVSSLSEPQAVLLHDRLTGRSLGSIVDLFNW